MKESKKKVFVVAKRSRSIFFTDFTYFNNKKKAIFNAARSDQF